MNNKFIKRALLSISISLLTSFGAFYSSNATAQDSWNAADDALEARKIERYQQLVDQSPEKSYAFQQLMATVGKGAAYQNLLKTYENKRDKKPDSFNLWMILGHMYAYGGQTHDALKAYKHALTLRPSALAYISIADAENENRNFDEATRAYEAALEWKPTKEQQQNIWRALAEIALYRRDMPRAERCFSKLIELEPNSIFVRRELAQIYAQNKMYPEARAILEQASKLASASANDREQLILEIGALYEVEGRLDDALSLYSSTSNKLPNNHWMQRELIARMSGIYRQQGNLNAFVDILDKKWTSPSYDQRLELADLYDEIAQPENAQKQIQAAIKAAPKRTEAREKLVDFHRSHGELAKMLDAQNALLQIAPHNFDYVRNLFESYSQNQQNDKAIQTLDHAAKTFSDDFDALHQIAQAYQNLGFASKALNIYENWIKKHPYDPEALEILGNLYDENDQKQKALTTWQKIEKAPIDSNTKLEILARIYDEHGLSSKAQSIYEEYAKANPKDCQMQMQYADLLTRNRDNTKAIEVYEKTAATCLSQPVRAACARRVAQIIQDNASKSKSILQYKGRIEDSPNDLALILFFAQISSALDAPEEAIPILESYLERNGNDADILRAIYDLALETADYNRARNALLQMATISETTKREALIATAEIDIKQGNLDHARQNLEDALKLNANDADTHERLGDVLLKLRLYRDAANVYETAFQIDATRYAVAFKNATCLSILALDDEADALYIRIAQESTDEALALKAAQRAIDDMSWRGGLDELARDFLPLLRSKQRKTLFIDILLKIADAQTRPLILKLKTFDPASLYSVKFNLKQLAEKYSQTLVEGLLSDDASLSSQALELCEWLSSPSVILVLAKKIDQAPQNDSGKDLQIRALRAIAHAQSPAAVEALHSWLAPRFTRAVREHALWALGLINTPKAAEILLDQIDSPLDSFRALAVIGLARHKAHLEAIQNKLRSDPSPLVKNASAWALAYHKVENAKNDILTQIDENNLKPYQLWVLNRIDEDNAPKRLIHALWNASNATRKMAIQLIQTENNDADLTQMTQSEILGAFLKSDASFYMSNVDIDALLDNFAHLSVSPQNAETINHDTISPNALQINTKFDDTKNPSIYSWLKAHESELLAEIKHIISQAPSQDALLDKSDDPQKRLLRDLWMPNSPLEIDPDNPEQREWQQKIARHIQDTLETWLTPHNTRATLAMRALASTNDDRAVQKLIDTIQSDDDKNDDNRTYFQIQAINALNLSNHPRARDFIIELSTNTDLLIRAAAVTCLDPDSPKERGALQNAAADPFPIVAQTAKHKLERISESQN